MQVWRTETLKKAKLRHVPLEKSTHRERLGSETITVARIDRNPERLTSMRVGVPWGDTLYMGLFRLPSMSSRAELAGYKPRFLCHGTLIGLHL